MKIIILIFLAATIFSGCIQIEVEPDVDNTLDSLYKNKIRIETHEKCEYIIITDGKDKFFTHKGNCKNPQHKPK